MKKFIATFVLAALCFVVVGGTAQQTVDAGANSYIVVLKENVSDTNAKTDALERAHGFASDYRYGYALKGFAANLSNAQLDKIKADADVKFVSPNHVMHVAGFVPVNGSDGVQPGIVRVGSATATTVHQASNVNVAILDTGIQFTHPDLNAVNGTNCIRKTRTADDDYGHGTHVAGILAAKNNGSGVVGMAPGTKLYAVKVIDSKGNGTTAQVICGIDWVTQNAAALNIKVANMSLIDNGSNDNNCGNTNADAMHQAICRSVAAGVTYVVSAGNDVTSFATKIPASYPEVLTVTSMYDSDGQSGGLGPQATCRTEKDDDYAMYNNWAVSQTDINHTIAAPGVCVKSTWLNSGYMVTSGTSMSTPNVAGAVALCIGNGGVAGACSGMTPAQIIQKIRGDAQAHATSTNGYRGDPFTPVGGGYFGYLLWAGGY